MDETERIERRLKLHDLRVLMSVVDEGSMAKAVREYEEAGDAMRYLAADGRVAWKATPGMLIRLGEAGQEAIDDMEDWP